MTDARWMAVLCGIALGMAIFCVASRPASAPLKRSVPIEIIDRFHPTWHVKV